MPAWLGLRSREMSVHWLMRAHKNIFECFYLLYGLVRLIQFSSWISFSFVLCVAFISINSNDAMNYVAKGSTIMAVVVTPLLPPLPLLNQNLCKARSRSTTSERGHRVNERAYLFMLVLYLWSSKLRDWRFAGIREQMKLLFRKHTGESEERHEDERKIISWSWDANRKMKNGYLII